MAIACKVLRKYRMETNVTRQILATLTSYASQSDDITVLSFPSEGFGSTRTTR